MPSTELLPDVAVPALPCVDHDGLLWVWLGTQAPAPSLPRLSPPEGFSHVAVVELDVPNREPEEVLQALRRAAEAPQRVGQGRLALERLRGEPELGGGGREQEAGAAIASVAARTLLGDWAASQPVAVVVAAPGVLLSTLRRECAPGAEDCVDRVFHQMHACLPSAPGCTRVLLRLSVSWLDESLFSSPGAPLLWLSGAREMLREQLATRGRDGEQGE
jgi:chlorophyllide a oxygenase